MPGGREGGEGGGGWRVGMKESEVGEEGEGGGWGLGGGLSAIPRLHQEGGWGRGAFWQRAAQGAARPAGMNEFAAGAYPAGGGGGHGGRDGPAAAEGARRTLVKILVQTGQLLVKIPK